MRFKNRLFVIFVIFISCFTCFQVPTLSNSLSDQNIRIGLFFSSTALSSAQISSKSINVLNDNNMVLTTLIGDNNYTIKPINQKIILMEKTYLDLTTALIEAQASNSLLKSNYFVYLNADGYKIASFENNLYTGISLSVMNPQIGVFASDSNPIIVYDDSLNIKFSSSLANDYIRIQNKPYRGSFSFKVDSANKLTAINILPIEEYLYGVVAKEMPASWNKEALKAQAISARNYSVKNLNKYSKQGFDLCTTQNSQVYGGVGAENVNTNKAVDETKGMLAYYNNEIAELYYHSSSGGKTEDSENIWSTSVPYLRSVEDSYSLGSPNDYWEYKISNLELEKLINNKGKNIGNLIGLKINRVSTNGRVLKLTLIGDKSEVVLEKESIRGFFGYSNLKSNWFELNGDFKQNSTITNDSYISALKDLNYYLNNINSTIYPNLNNNDIITSQDYLFKGKGYGHGLGLSQYGAKTMAEQGFTYDEILKYYFKGIDVY